MAKKKKKSKRICLRCDREFMSEGPFNRVCPGCREINANINAGSIGSIPNTQNNNFIGD